MREFNFEMMRMVTTSRVHFYFQVHDPDHLPFPNRVSFPFKKNNRF